MRNKRDLPYQETTKTWALAETRQESGAATK